MRDNVESGNREKQDALARVPFRLPEQEMRELKDYASRHNLSMNQLLSEAANEYIAGRRFVPDATFITNAVRATPLGNLIRQIHSDARICEYRESVKSQAEEPYLEPVPESGILPTVAPISRGTVSLRKVGTAVGVPADINAEEYLEQHKSEFGDRVLATAMRGTAIGENWLGQLEKAGRVNALENEEPVTERLMAFMLRCIPSDYMHPNMAYVLSPRQFQAYMFKRGISPDSRDSQNGTYNRSVYSNVVRCAGFPDDAILFTDPENLILASSTPEIEITTQFSSDNRRYKSIAVKVALGAKIETEEASYLLRGLSPPSFA